MAQEQNEAQNGTNGAHMIHESTQNTTNGLHLPVQKIENGANGSNGIQTPSNRTEPSINSYLEPTNKTEPIENSNENSDNQPGGRFGYRLGHKLGNYEVPDIILDACSKKVKVISIGAGISGILMSYLIQKHGNNIEHVVYEKNGDIGGTWLENRYPGCACDVPSHAYTFAFALYPDWPEFLSASEDIYRYLNRVVECFDLRKYMTFNSAIVDCDWNEAEGKWHVTIEDTMTHETREDVCDIVVAGSGVLNSWRMPEDIEGLNSFKGRLIHSARWPEDYWEDEWKGEKVALIGSGATSIQIVPKIQPHVKQLDIFIRTPVWFVEIAGHSGNNYQYSDDERNNLRANAEALVNIAKDLEGRINTAMGIKSTMTNSAEAKLAREYCTQAMRKLIKDDTLFEQLLPDFAVGCRRPTPGNPYMRAVQQPNVKIHRSAVSKVTPTSIIGSNGDEVEVDAIVCATGFDVSFKPRYSVIGKNGASLQAKWRHIPESYLSVTVPDIPNYFIMIGPTFPIANGSVMGPLQSTGKYILQMIQKIQREHIHSISPKQSVTDAFNEHTQAWTQSTCWADPRCRSWYKNNKTGRVNAIWPGGSLHFCKIMETPRYEDYEIKYDNKENMWAFMGLGFTEDMLSENPDHSPYIGVNEIDPRFIGFKPNEMLENERVKNRGIAVRDLPQK